MVIAGPTDESNWVIPGMLMAGAYPAANDDALHYDILSSLLTLGLGPLPNSHGDLTCAAQNSEGAHKERCSGRIGEVRAK